LSTNASPSRVVPATTHLSKQRRAEFLLLATTLIWGSTFVTQKIGLVDVSPLFFVGSRFIIASLVLTVLFPKKIKNIDKNAFQKGTALGILLCLGFVLQTVGLTYTSASKSAFITGMLVVFTPLMQFVIERQFPKLGNILGVLLVTIGLYLLTSPEGSTFNLGDGLTLACAILFAIYIVYLDIVSKETDIFHLTFLQIVVTGLLSVILALLFENIRVEYTTSFLFVLFYLSLFATLLTTFIQTKFQKDTSPTRAAIIFSIEPVFAAVLAYLVLNEAIGLLGIVGGAVIVVGLLTSQLSDQIPFLDAELIRATEEKREAS
jgi:drug/metabolite transporter (DMT)-like permease